MDVLRQDHNHPDPNPDVLVYLVGGTNSKEGNVFALNPDTGVDGPICDHNWDAADVSVDQNYTFYHSCCQCIKNYSAERNLTESSRLSHCGVISPKSHNFILYVLIFRSAGRRTMVTMSSESCLQGAFCKSNSHWSELLNGDP